MTNEQLCIESKNGNTTAEEELIRTVSPFIRAIAIRLEKEYSGLRVETDDLVQEGSVGLIKAVQTFRPESGNLFLTYASRFKGARSISVFGLLHKGIAH